MPKIKLDANAATYPMPVVLVGAQVNGKPNYMAVGWITQANINPPMLAVALNRSRLTVEGISENETFSVNLPSGRLVDKTDFCGMVSGKKRDKSRLFTTFYGNLKTAPMIEECPLCIECRLFNSLELPSHSIFVGEIAGVYADQDCMNDGKLDMKKIDPFLLTMPDNHYRGLGAEVAKAWSTGKKLLEK